jgi:hypothetical protein
MSLSLRTASLLLLASISACASGGDADDPYETAEGAITDNRAATLVEKNRYIQVRSQFGSTGWDMPESVSSQLTDEEVLAMDTSVESGRYDVSAKDMRLASATSGSCANPGDPVTSCEWEDAIFELHGRYYVRRSSFMRSTPRDADVRWYLILDQASASWVVGRLASGEKRDGHDDVYFTLANKFVENPASVPQGTKEGIGSVETPSGTFVSVFERPFLFLNDGRVWRLDLDRDCPNTQTFNGVGCV